MSRTTSREFRYTVDANSSIVIPAPGQVFRCINASASFEIEIDNATAIFCDQGLGYRFETPFTKVRVINDSAADITVQILIAEGDVMDSRLSLPGDLVAMIGGGSVTFSRKNIASGERKLIATENPLRLEVTIANEGNAPVYIGGDDVSFWGAHMSIAAGYERTIKTTGELYAYSQAAGIQTLQIMENVR
ncbi:hypothetical protein [Planktotalea arctica]|uniref:hypothetical protein n=1 Tax=Planktotalea arctica TaxID=1481893 RepID=UPI00321A3795